MSTGSIVGLMQNSVKEVLILVVPILALALIVGLIVAIFQATTSIQEQTLTFLPKLIVILLVIAFFAGAGFSHLGNFTKALFSQIPNLAK